MTPNDAGPLPQTPRGRRRSRSRQPRILWLLLSLLLAVLATACGGSATAIAGADHASASAVNEPQSESSSRTAPTTPVVPAEPRAAESSAPAVTETSAPTPIPALGAELPRAPIGFEGLFDSAERGPQPISIAIENINVTNAVVIPVGVDEHLEFEVPPADQVGWYRFGSAPGEPGSAVLAAHIAYNGVDGVFRYLEDVEVGSIVSIGFDDGSSQRYLIEEVIEYVKEELPDSLFARTGDSRLALITCGGAFNYQLDSYESNTVAIAVPL